MSNSYVLISIRIKNNNYYELIIRTRTIVSGRLLIFIKQLR